MALQKKHAGYTIVEVLIFLAVSGVMFVSAMLMIDGQRGKTEFQNSVRLLESQINDVANDVATGFYATDTGTVTCQGGFNPVRLDTGSGVEIGTNSECLLIGRVIQFAPDSNPTDMHIFTVAGRRRNGQNDVNTLAQSGARLIANSQSGSDSSPDIYETFSTGSAQVVWVRSPASLFGTAETFGGIGVFSNFDTITKPFSQTATASIAGIINTSTDIPRGKFVANTNNNLSSLTLNPRQGINICVNSLGSNQHAIISILGRGTITTSSQVNDGSCS
jgi:type II secretory pathway pseudopilin PulG